MITLTRELFEEIRSDLHQEIENKFGCQVRQMEMVESLSDLDQVSAIHICLEFYANETEYQIPLKSVYLVDFVARTVSGHLNIDNLFSAQGFTLKN